MKVYFYEVRDGLLQIVVTREDGTIIERDGDRIVIRYPADKPDFEDEEFEYERSHLDTPTSFWYEVNGEAVISVEEE
jgi:hypothetical protein